MSRNVQIALMLAVATVALIAGVLLRQGTSSPPEVGPGAEQQLLTAELPDLDGRKQRLEQWKGKVVVVNFWATWCAPCREEMPALVRTQARLGSKGLQVVGIAVDQPDRVRSFATEIGVNYPLLVGELEVMDLAKLAGNELGALPYTVILDRSGRIVRTQLGGVTEASLEGLVAGLL